MAALAAAKRRASLPARPTSRFEQRLRAQGMVRIAGVDEVGRGSLFGPVVAAAVILDPDRPIRGLNDSKQLDSKRRETLSERIHERALAVSIAGVDSGHIDRWNIYQATRRAMLQAVLALDPPPDCLLVDAMKIELEIPQKPVIGGDARSFSIAAASIVAKVARDGWMRHWDEVYPQYGLASNKGYSTPDHMRALEQFGPTPLHRHSFRPVACCAKFPGELPLEGTLESLPLFADLEMLEISRR
jgi:ribonuclease HII